MLGFPNWTFYCYNNGIIVKQTLDVNQQLRKRYYLIERAKDAKVQFTKIIKIISIIKLTICSLALEDVWYSSSYACCRRLS